jgi:hypothetical protein
MDFAIAISRVGLAVLLIGVILCNLAVFRMSKVVRRYWMIRDNQANKKVIRMYRAKHPDGPLYRDLKIGYWIGGIGIAVVLAGILIRPRV